MIGALLKGLGGVGAGIARGGAQGLGGIGKSFWNGGLAKRMLIGGVSGGVLGAGYSAFDTQAATPERFWSDVARGAVGGMGLGVVAGTIPSLAKMGAARFLGTTSRELGNLGRREIMSRGLSGIGNTFRQVGSTAWNLGNQVRKYPGVFLAGGAVAAGAYAVSNTVAPAVNDVRNTMTRSRLEASYNKNAALFEDYEQSGNVGIVPSPLGQRVSTADFMNSTNGLVQGLSRGRHGS
jgi:hypothetical protein